jgi:hypothetical protein
MSLQRKLVRLWKPLLASSVPTPRAKTSSKPKGILFGQCWRCSDTPSRCKPLWEIFSVFSLRGVAWHPDSPYDVSVASIEDGLTGISIRGGAAGRRANPSHKAGAQSLWASSYVCMGGSRVAEQGGGATKSSALMGEGRKRMAAEDHDGGSSPSANPTKVVRPLDDPARGPASGNSVQGGPNTAGKRHQALFIGSTGIGHVQGGSTPMMRRLSILFALAGCCSLVP